ncbi:hypothetical protein EDD16DRAFT_1617495 [Pisolithus croceorrhizus]|nr:hypothetical protein EDD16DRAFT_1617495 [Pisolithus croceorrhizus]
MRIFVLATGQRLKWIHGGSRMQVEEVRRAPLVVLLMFLVSVASLRSTFQVVRSGTYYARVATSDSCDAANDKRVVENKSRAQGSFDTGRPSWNASSGFNGSGHKNRRSLFVVSLWGSQRALMTLGARLPVPPLTPPPVARHRPPRRGMPAGGHSSDR